MLSIQRPSESSSSSSHKFTANILPCRIHHSGPVNANKRHWNVESDEKGRKVAYFRGRKLLGRDVRVGKNYRGIVVRNTGQTIARSTTNTNGKTACNGGHPPESSLDDEEDEEGEEPEPMKVLEEIGTFDQMIVWGHEKVPEDDETFVRGVEEWIGFAEAMHSFDDEEAESKS